jgi:hypothetical protein
MDILKALQAEESKFLKQMSTAKEQLETVRAAIKLLGGKKLGKKTRSVSAAAKKKMSRAAKLRWKKVKAEKKSGV